MDTIETIHLSTKDLSCPICYQKYTLTTYQPMSLSCGHNICSHCLKKVWNCPLCRARIQNRGSIVKNVLISCILEQKEKVKECKVHNRPLEFFCKDHKQLICVDCAIEGGHFSHNFVRVKDVDNRAQKIKSLMKKVDSKDEQSTHKFKSFLEKEKKTLKRRVDEFLDEYLEPLLTIKKKLHKEVDSFMIMQGKTYENESTRESIVQWKKDNENIVSEWENKGEAEAAIKIVNNETEEIEKKISNYESQVEKAQAETLVNMDYILKNIREKMSHTKGPWKKLNRKIGQIMTTFKSETNPSMEKEYLLEFLIGNGIEGAWVEKEDESILQIKGEDRNIKVKELEMKYFDCTLDKLTISCQMVQGIYFDIICRVIEHIQQLIDLKLFLQNLRDDELSTLSDSLPNMNSLQRLSINLQSKNITNIGFGKLLAASSSLQQLQILELNFKECDELAQERIIDLEASFAKLKTLTQLTLTFKACDNIANEAVMFIFQGLSNLLNLSKLNLKISDCKNLSCKIIEPLGKALTALSNLEELSIGLEGFYEPSNPIVLITLANGISSLTKLQKLELSFIEDVYFPSYVIRKFFSKFIPHVTNLTELSIDLTKCKEVGNATFENIGISLSLLPQLNKLTLRCRHTNISEKGVLAFGNHLLKATSLKALFLDYRNCKNVETNSQAKINEAFSKLTKLTEKELLFGGERQDQTNTLETPGNMRRRITSHNFLRLFSPVERLRENYLDIDGVDDRFMNAPESDPDELFEEYLRSHDFEGRDYDGRDSGFDDDYALMSIHSSDLSFDEFP